MINSNYSCKAWRINISIFYFRVSSVSRKGNPYDNVLMESFYRTLKRELVQDAKFENPEQARMEIFKYIELEHSIYKNF